MTPSIETVSDQRLEELIAEYLLGLSDATECAPDDIVGNTTAAEAGRLFGDVLAALRELRQMRGEGWQAIETAPENTPIWLYGRNDEGEEVQSCGVLSRGTAPAGNKYERFDVVGVERWEVSELSYMPTHWRRLPAPPTRSAP